MRVDIILICKAVLLEEGASRLRAASVAGLEMRLLLQVGQVAASLAFVALYIWSTYEPVTRGSWRHTADLVLSAVFAADLAARVRAKAGRPQHAEACGG
ncbi:hypothetical protein GPECTOR_97g772 [Gonium pectorale]|uniref:Cation-transporting P-type ATPase C-terminal domain-containing protein n=1 Tax=Gonium pectorale TaxID=33097 RepID=A0A150G067_GONPE|nr:hypothetical protein GPECTOR_97g772 [Gonium pectorale]|eukprot:KXZ43234.1 hypothetical protein GPECTOR_97g772 [Gonium pectorale]